MLRVFDFFASHDMGNSKEPQLYKIKKDRGEKNNVAAENPDMVAKLKTYIEGEKAKR